MIKTVERPSARGAAPTRSDADFRICVGGMDPAAHVSLPLVRGGCWQGLLGGFELPPDDALELLATGVAGWTRAPDRVEIVGAPAACLLPVLWLRTIWLSVATPLTLHWPRVAAPGADPREQLAARLCCGLVSDVRCDDAPGAESMWGITPGPSRPLGAGAFDLLLGIVDCWDIRQRTGPITDPSEWHMRARAAMEDCRDRGLTRIALFGAGTHTRALGPLLLAPPVEIACIIDDDIARHGGRMWGFPVVSKSQAVEMGVQAVILSANVHEPKLWESAASLRDSGVQVVRLYGEA